MVVVVLVGSQGCWRRGYGRGAPASSVVTDVAAVAADAGICVVAVLLQAAGAQMRVASKQLALHSGESPEPPRFRSFCLNRRSFSPAEFI